MPQYIIKTAIINRKTITFTYNNQKRYVQPHHFGIFGNTVQLHAFQTSTGYFSGGWRNFKINDIEDIKATNHTFTPQDSYNPDNCKYKTIIHSVYESYNADSIDEPDGFTP